MIDFIRSLSFFDYPATATEEVRRRLLPGVESCRLTESFEQAVRESKETRPLALFARIACPNCTVTVPCPL
jgi:hypothetical protein